MLKSYMQIYARICHRLNREMDSRSSQDLPELNPDEEQVLRADISPRSGRKIFVVRSEEVNVLRRIPCYVS